MFKKSAKLFTTIAVQTIRHHARHSFRGDSTILFKRMDELEGKYEKLLKATDVALGEFCRVADANTSRMYEVVDNIDKKTDAEINDLRNEIGRVRIDTRDIIRVLRNAGYNIEPFEHNIPIKNASVVQKEREDFIQKLKNEGHKCIIIKESYPIQVGWCGHDQCSCNGG